MSAQDRNGSLATLELEKPPEQRGSPRRPWLVASLIRLSTGSGREAPQALTPVASDEHTDPDRHRVLVLPHQEFRGRDTTRSPTRQRSSTRKVAPPRPAKPWIPGYGLGFELLLDPRSSRRRPCPHPDQVHAAGHELRPAKISTGGPWQATDQTAQGYRHHGLHPEPLTPPKPRPTTTCIRGPNQRRDQTICPRARTDGKIGREGCNGNSGSLIPPEPIERGPRLRPRNWPLRLHRTPRADVSGRQKSVPAISVSVVIVTVAPVRSGDSALFLEARLEHQETWGSSVLIHPPVARSAKIGTGLRKCGLFLPDLRATTSQHPRAGAGAMNPNASSQSDLTETSACVRRARRTRSSQESASRRVGGALNTGVVVGHLARECATKGHLAGLGASVRASRVYAAVVDLDRR